MSALKSLISDEWGNAHKKPCWWIIVQASYKGTWKASQPAPTPYSTSSSVWSKHNTLLCPLLTNTHTKVQHMCLTWEEVSLEALLGDGVVGFKLNPHVVILRGDDLRDLRAAVFTMQLRVGWKAAAHLHKVVFTHLNTQTRLLEHGRATMRSISLSVTDNPPTHTYLISLQLEGLKLHGDAVLSGGDHLPHAVLVGRVLFRPAGRADGPVQLREETAARRCGHTAHVTRTLYTCSHVSQWQKRIEKEGVLSVTHISKLWWSFSSVWVFFWQLLVFSGGFSDNFLLKMHWFSKVVNYCVPDCKQLESDM